MTSHEVMFSPFNGDPRAAAEVARLIDTFDIRCVIETGLFYGYTTAWFAQHMAGRDTQVHGVEISEFYLREAGKRTAEHDHVQLHLGPSQRVLPKLLPTLTADPILLYLDAHWHAEWPLTAELTAIAKACHDRAILVIDDFKVPGRDLAYDTYELPGGGRRPCDLDAIVDTLPALAKGVRWYFNQSPEGPARTGKLYVGPARLFDEHLEAWAMTQNGVRYSTLS